MQKKPQLELTHDQVVKNEVEANAIVWLDNAAASENSGTGMLNRDITGNFTKRH